MENEIAVWAGVVGGLASAVVATLLTHLLASARLERSKRREIQSFLTSLDWELQTAKVKINASNVTSLVTLPSLVRLCERGLVGRLPVSLLQEAFSINLALDSANELVTLIWKGLDLAVQTERKPPQDLLEDLRSSTREWFSAADEHVEPAREAIRPFIDRRIRHRIARFWWWHVRSFWS